MIQEQFVFSLCPQSKNAPDFFCLMYSIFILIFAPAGIEGGQMMIALLIKIVSDSMESQNMGGWGLLIHFSSGGMQSPF